MDPRELFIERCKQIKKSIESGTQIEVLDLSRLLRQLFLDSSPLIDIVNKAARLKLSFEARPIAPRLMFADPQPLFVSLDDGIDPYASEDRGRGVVTLTTAQFLAHTVMLIDGTRISVMMVIKFGAHHAGGVHYDPKKARGESLAIQHWHRTLAIGGYPAGIRMLRGIAKVALRGLQPLIDECRTTLDRDWPRPPF